MYGQKGGGNEKGIIAGRGNRRVSLKTLICWAHHQQDNKGDMSSREREGLARTRGKGEKENGDKRYRKEGEIREGTRG